MGHLFSFSRRGPRYLATCQITGATCFVERRGKAWVAWRRGQMGPQARTRALAADALHGRKVA